MFKTIQISVCMILALGTVATAQQVAFEKYLLPNGMTVILHEDHSLPIAIVNTWYHVGAKDEVERRSGFAHLFEHLMFMGTERVPNGDFDSIMEAGGGWNNASTGQDRTNYFDVGPAELLPTLLWLEADRLESLGVAMTQEKLDKQRDVVRNERRQTSENQPYGKAELMIHPTMFPKDHPYHIPVIGSHEDLQAATVDDVKNFFAQYYVPSNASMVVAGDFDPQEIKPLIAKLFGSLPRGNDVAHATAKPVRLDEVKRLTMTDDVQFARTMMVYHSPARLQPGDAEMDLAADILASGISSRLYKRLIYDESLATRVSAYQASMQLGSTFHIIAMAKPGVSLDRIEQVIDEEVKKLTTKGPTAEELNRQKAQWEYSAVSRLQSMQAKADRLNAYEYFFSEPDSFKRDMDRYRNATPESIRKWTQSVLTPDARFILRVLPEQKMPESNPRDQRPALVAKENYAPPEPTIFRLSNGITVHHWTRHELPLVSVRLLIEGGASLVPPDKAGLADLTADMLDEGAGSLGAVTFSDALDQLGANLFTFSGQDTTTVGLSALSSKLDAAMSLFADAVLRPRFDEKEWERVQKLHIDSLQRGLDQPTIVAANVGARVLFGDAHPYSRSVSGTMATAKQLTLDDIRLFHSQLFRPDNATILMAGDLSADEAKEKLELALGSWKATSGVAKLAEPSYPAPENDSFRVVVVDRPDAVQTVIRFVMPAPSYGDPARPQLELMNTILGGSFTSRLNQNLREAHGYTYGARSGFTMSPRVGYFVASSSVRADVTGASLTEFLKEFRALRSGDISTEEASKARTNHRMDLMSSFEGLNGTLSAAATLVRNNRPFSQLGDDLRLVSQIDEGALNRLAYNAVPLEKAVLVLVGDKATILKQLEGLDLPQPVEMTPEGVAK